MGTAVPDVIARYFAADARHDFDAVIAEFANDAVVIDEGETRRGAAEIRAWKESTSAQYEYTTELLGAEPDGEDAFLVTGRLEGTFPGGVAVLKWRFGLTGGRISRLEIAP